MVIHPASASPNRTIDTAEVARFDRMAAAWWDPDGVARPLHMLTPARMTYLRDTILRHTARQADGLKPLSGLAILDIGCGGGLVTEPLARMGATVTGIDPGHDSIMVADEHARRAGLAITYRADRAEALVREGLTFDVVTCLEVVEHVPDVPAFISAIAPLVRPGGLLLLSTINRTLTSYAVAILGAEYVLRWLPVGTHSWDKFVKPDELGQAVTAAGFQAPAFRGLVFDPLRSHFSLSDDTAVNYFAAATRPASPS